MIFHIPMPERPNSVKRSNFARMLFEFGNYSGVGIKTALGMGCLHIEERRKKNNERSGSQADSGKSSS